MPKVKESPTVRMDRAFQAAVKAGQIMRGEGNPDTEKLVTVGHASFYRKMNAPGGFSVTDTRILAQRYFNDRQLCEAFGVEYHGKTEP